MTTLTPTVTIHTPDGQQYQVAEQPMARGTYGAVCAIDEHPELAAKMFTTRPHSPRRRAHIARKISEMVENGPPDMPDGVHLAWPIAAIKTSTYDETNEIAGYVMRRMPDQHSTLATLVGTDPGSHQAERAAQLMQKATQALHDAGIVIGDISGHNAAMAQGELWLFDTDGWQFQSEDGNLYYAEGITYGYAHPQLAAVQQHAQANCADFNCPYAGEIHQMTASCRPRYPTHDNFALSRITSQLTRRPEQPADTLPRTFRI